jgi:dynein heavy chain
MYVQHSFEKKMEKKRKNLFGAPKGKKIIAFVDDVNMPAPDKHLAQPPIELLRQVLDQKGFYERDKLFWIELEDVLHCAASAPPGGGRHTLPPRFLRHYAVACMPSPNADKMRGILQGLLEGFMGTFEDSIFVLSGNMINATLDLYTRITTNLLPTPSRSHYLFNLRDISKVFQGVRMGDTRSVGSAETMGRLWLHELTRVFHDRLVNESDREWFYHTACELIIKHFRFGGDGWSQEELFPAGGSDDDEFAVEGKKVNVGDSGGSPSATKRTKKKQVRRSRHQIEDAVRLARHTPRGTVPPF